MEGRERLTGASVISAEVKTLVGALFSLGTLNSDNPQISPGEPQPLLTTLGATGKFPLGSYFFPRPLTLGTPRPGPLWPLSPRPEPGLTFLPVSVEDLDVFELDANACPQGHRVCGIVFAPALDGAVGVSPGGKERTMSRMLTGAR